MKVLLDTNVVLDLILDREPFATEALQIFALADAGKLELALSSDAISLIFYLVSKNKNKQTARLALVNLLDYVTLCPLDEHTVLQGIALDFDDIEDALVTSVAIKAQAQAIITRNVKDFKNSPLSILTPKELLAFWAEAQH